jgi:hypothetical protein
MSRTHPDPKGCQLCVSALNKVSSSTRMLLKHRDAPACLPCPPRPVSPLRRTQMLPNSQPEF